MIDPPRHRNAFARRCAVLSGMLLFASASVALAQPILSGAVRISIEASGNSPAAGQCLLRGSNSGPFMRGSAGNGPIAWCGFQSKTALRENGQAIFDLVYVAAQDAYLLWQGNSECLVAAGGNTTGVMDCTAASLTSAGVWRIDASLWLGTSLFATIRSKADDRCLVFANSGRDVRPTLHRWPDDPRDSLYCGLGLNALRRSGQGLFELSPPLN